VVGYPPFPPLPSASISEGAFFLNVYSYVFSSLYTLVVASGTGSKGPNIKGYEALLMQCFKYNSFVAFGSYWIP